MKYSWLSYWIQNYLITNFLIIDDFSAVATTTTFPLGSTIPIAASFDQKTHQPLILLLDECVASTTPELGPDSQIYPLITNKGYVRRLCALSGVIKCFCSTAVEWLAQFLVLLPFKMDYGVTTFFVFTLRCLVDSKKTNSRFLPRNQLSEIRLSLQAFKFAIGEDASLCLCLCLFLFLFVFVFVCVCLCLCESYFSFAPSSGLPALQTCGMGPKRPGW